MTLLPSLMCLRSLDKLLFLLRIRPKSTVCLLWRTNDCPLKPFWNLSFSSKLELKLPTFNLVLSLSQDCNVFGALNAIILCRKLKKGILLNCRLSLRDHLCITSTKGGWVEKMTIFAYIVFMLIEWVGGLEKVQTFADVVYGW